MTLPNMFSIFVVLLFYYFSHSQGQHSQEHSNPILVHVLFRHGDRTPIAGSIYPKDPHKNETYSPFGLEQLTPKGKKRMFELGKFIRKRYDKLLGDFYTPEMLRAYSSDIDRTKMSMQLVLAGLFPPRGVEIWNEELSWQPIPYHTLRADQDKLFFGTVCPNYVKQYIEYRKSEKVMELYKKKHELLQYLSEYTGWNITFFDLVYDLYFNLSAELDWGLELEYWTKNVYPEELERITVEQYQIYSGTTELLKLASGYWLQKIISDTEQKMNVTLPQERKVFLYSGHERNIANFLYTLDAFDQQVPGYGSAVFIELHRINGIFGIQVVYRNNDNNPKLLTLPGCGQFCPWEKFVGLVEKYLPSDSESSCGGPMLNRYTYKALENIK